MLLLNGRYKIWLYAGNSENPLVLVHENGTWLFNMSSENSHGADNQQERLLVAEQKRWFLAGLIEGEGSLCVSIKRHETARFGYYVDPEFFLYQHKSRSGLLDLAMEVFGTGRIFPKPGNEVVLVYSITSQRLLRTVLLPFYERYMAFSNRKSDYQLFKEILSSLENKEHWTPHGMIEVVEKAYRMNMNGKQRKRPIEEVTRRILRGHTPDTP